jgi:hypothetical protein
MQEIADFISQVGFPIAACGGMFYLTYRILAEIVPTLGKMDKTLDHILDYFREQKDDEK